MRADMSEYSSKLADTATRPAERSRCRTWNHGWAILTPSSFASLLRAMQAPSFELRTTSGRRASCGANTRSHEQYMLLASMSANMDPRAGSDLERPDHRRHDAPDFERRVRRHV